MARRGRPPLLEGSGTTHLKDFWLAPQIWGGRTESKRALARGDLVERYRRDVRSLKRNLLGGLNPLGGVRKF